MNIRAATLFFWGFLIATATLAGERHRAEIVTVLDSDRGMQQVHAWTGDELCDDRVHGEHEAIAMK